MRRLTFSVAVLFTSFAFGDDKPDGKGVKITSEDGKVSAVFPHEPTGKEADGKLHFYTRKDGTAVWIRRSVLEVDLTDKEAVKRVFEGGRNGGIGQLKGKLLSKKDLRLGKYPGHTYDAATKTGSVYRSRMYLTGKHIVQIGILGPKEDIDGPEAKKFLDSLKIEE